MEVLVLGANGLLGSNVVARAGNRRWEPLAGFHSAPPEYEGESVSLDITNTEKVATVLDDRDPDAIVNCAAMTDVDGCERSPEQAREVNGHAPGRLAAIASSRNMDFVQVSTDYVFDGRADRPYREDAPTDPLQVYGSSKLLGEQEVTDAHPAALVPRLSFVWGRRGDTGDPAGFPPWVRQRLDDDDPIPLFVDQHVTPTRAGQAAETILDLLATGATGIVNVACRTCTTPYEMGNEIAGILEQPTTQLRESCLADADREADRPVYSCLDVTRVESLLERKQPSLREDLVAGL